MNANSHVQTVEVLIYIYHCPSVVCPLDGGEYS